MTGVIKSFRSKGMSAKPKIEILCLNPGVFVPCWIKKSFSLYKPRDLKRLKRRLDHEWEMFSIGEYEL